MAARVVAVADTLIAPFAKCAVTGLCNQSTLRYAGLGLSGVYMSLKRIEDAITKLEAAAPHVPGGLAELQASNARLREAVLLSLTQIDALIAQHGGEPEQ